MEALTRLVADSLARHGFDRPVDPRRLQWSRWFRCDSTHSLLIVPSKPGIFALAEEIMDLAASNTSGASKIHVGTAAPGCPAEQSSAVASAPTSLEGGTGREGHDFSRAVMSARNSPALAAEESQRRMLAVLQFSEDDNMAFTLDRMFTCANPMRARLASGRCFLRFVVIEDQTQRRNICNALNQWIHSSAEKASGIGVDFQSSLELTDVGTARVGRTLLSDNASTTTTPAQTAKAQASDAAPQAPNLDSGANKNLHCPHPLPSGF
ncbi:MAG: hypothetical protein WA651_15245 [Candidatus Sulfotelmatobacter sp.]